MKLSRNKVVLKISDWTLAGGAMIASILLAQNNWMSKWAYVFFILSSFGGAYVGYYHRVKSLLVTQVFYILIDVYAVYRWFF